MMPDLRDLAAQIIALPGWEWRPGMRAILPISGRGIHIQSPDAASGICGCPGVGSLPDLTDPATAGAMLGILMVGGGIGVALVSTDGDGRWYAGSGPIWHSSPAGSGATPGEAIARMVVARRGWR